MAIAMVEWSLQLFEIPAPNQAHIVGDFQLVFSHRIEKDFKRESNVLYLREVSLFMRTDVVRYILYRISARMRESTNLRYVNSNCISLPIEIYVSSLFVQSRRTSSLETFT